MALLEWPIWSIIAGVAAFLGGGVIAIYSGVDAYVRNFLNDLKASGEETDSGLRLRTARALMAPSPWTIYVSTLRQSLKKLDELMGVPKDWNRGLGWCIAIAFIYPPWLLILGWGFGGSATVGATDILPQFHWPGRMILILVLVALAYAIFFIATRRQDRIDDWWQDLLERQIYDRFPRSIRNRIKQGLPLALILVAAVSIAAAGIAAAGIPVPGQGAFLLFVSSTLLFMAMALAMLGLLAQGLALCIFFVGAIAITEAVAAVEAGYISIVMVTAGSIGIVFSRVVTKFSATYFPKSRAKGLVLPIVIAWVGIIVSMLFLAAWLIGEPFGAGWTTTIVLFWTVLPLINALMDWFSWTISRRLGKDLLYISEQPAAATGRRVWIFSRDICVDVFAAFALLIALAWLLPRVIELWNWLVRLNGGEPTLLIAGYLCDAAKAPLSDGLWATGMLFSTLLPTVLHLSFLLMAPVVWFLTPTLEARARAGHIAAGYRPPDADLEGAASRWRDLEPLPANFGADHLTRDVVVNDRPLNPGTAKAVARQLRLWRPLLLIIAAIVALMAVYALGGLFIGSWWPLPQLLLYIAMNFDWPTVQQCFPETADPSSPLQAITI